MDKPDEPDLLQIATAISDGAAVDWARVTAPLEQGHAVGVLREMAVLEGIAQFHRKDIESATPTDIRRANRHAPPQPLDPAKAAADPSPLEEAIGRETLERYESALLRLRPTDREAIMLRIELNYPYADIATALGKPSIAAAQMTVSRALVRLAEEMARGQA